MYQIINASPKAKQKIKDGAYEAAKPANLADPHANTKYPFDALAVGQSFAVPIAEAEENSLRMLSVTKGKKTEKKFTVIKHREFACIEVARIG